MYKFLLLVLLTTGTLQAWDCIQEPYVTVGGGAVFPMRNSSAKGDSSSVLFAPTVPGSSLFKLTDVVWKSHYKAGFEVNGAIGCTLCCNWKLGAEFLYQNIHRDISGTYTWNEFAATTGNLFATSNETVRKASSRVNIYALLTDLDYVYRGCPCWSFNIGGGVGVAWLQSRKTTRNDILIVDMPPLVESSPVVERSPTLYGTAFAWQLKIGLGYDVCQDFSLSLNYRLFGTTRFHARASSITSNPDTDAEAVFNIPQDEIRGLLNSSVNLSLTYMF